jgi:putative ABC transport system ATP-binding protein
VSAAPIIELDGVYRTYPGPPSVEALRPVDLVVDAGDFVTIAGPSGSGKSTLLNLLGFLDRPSGGRYLLDGADVAALTDAERAAIRGRHVGFVFQAFHLLGHRTVLENVVLAQLYNRTPRRERVPAAVAALERVGLGHRMHALPTTLSGGERQRVAIARALVCRPRVVLCDEPTGNLDSHTAASVLELLGGLHADGLTILVITHDPAVASRGTRRVTIRDGVLSDDSVAGAGTAGDAATA